ncbi:hypothetical protein PPERSA_02844 [Pseudocohnilembus persalinus]|uniref:Transmembrane protein n=1 Tax=Pseudocohnilembus persalinus TaxID=266149 RepID=A0A0V0QM71_PSEPJ|nr:hypothetical protein PPERSA_02844 [Pseudocohnilembus persalinus]|eukprot:KRX03465.1 hypothetical protein PPERSA_02844 [Pseudocohnilembus persalinus]
MAEEHFHQKRECYQCRDQLSQQYKNMYFDEETLKEDKFTSPIIGEGIKINSENATVSRFICQYLLCIICQVLGDLTFGFGKHVTMPQTYLRHISFIAAGSYLAYTLFCLTDQQIDKKIVNLIFSLMIYSILLQSLVLYGRKVFCYERERKKLTVQDEVIDVNFTQFVIDSKLKLITVAEKNSFFKQLNIFFGKYNRKKCLKVEDLDKVNEDNKVNYFWERIILIIELRSKQTDLTDDYIREEDKRLDEELKKINDNGGDILQLVRLRRKNVYNLKADCANNAQKQHRLNLELFRFSRDITNAIQSVYTISVFLMGFFLMIDNFNITSFQLQTDRDFIMIYMTYMIVMAFNAGWILIYSNNINSNFQDLKNEIQKKLYQEIESDYNGYIQEIINNEKAEEENVLNQQNLGDIKDNIGNNRIAKNQLYDPLVQILQDKALMEYDTKKHAERILYYFKVKLGTVIKYFIAMSIVFFGCFISP